MSPAVLDPGAVMRLPDRSRPCRPRASRPAAGRARGLSKALSADVSRRPSRRLGPADHARVRQFLPLAYRLALWYSRVRARDVPMDDLIAEALYGLTYAVSRYD